MKRNRSRAVKPDSRADLFKSSPRLSPTQAERLTGATRKSGKIPYLLRGLCIGCSKGDFMLLRRGTEFAVHYAGAVILDKRVRQWPVVAWLDQAPTQLYVSCSAT